ncbi:MAG: Na/Pi cotransporter family protein [Ruminococcaceae bacterium]|nr:Na/Pi cotransporter family protein [Oscillospiraceae bacterium]
MDNIGLYVTIAIQVIGGLCLFLFGMNLMGDSLEKAAGMRMQKIIESLTGNLLKGVLVGALVTAVIQSSSATTVMVVGFVSAGIMTLKQAAGIIMGANIGTTITAHILRLNDVSSENFFLSFFKPDNLMFVLIIAGMLLIYMAKNQTKKDAGGIFIGLSLIFAGMMFMSDGLNGIDKSVFETLFAFCANMPFLGIIIGAVVTAIIQSSSASVGILQAVASTGAITLGGAIPIILGQNIGTCVTAVLSSMGATKTAKKASVLHLTFNILGTLLFIVALFFVCPYVVPGWNILMNGNVNSGSIADFHTIFNITTTIILFPFAGLLVKLIGGSKEQESMADKPSRMLDERFLHSPAIAIGQSKNVVISMLELAKKNIVLSEAAMLEKNSDAMTEIKLIEKNVDTMESELSSYLGKINDKTLSESENRQTMAYISMVSDIERISDHASNMSDIAKMMIEDDQKLSKGGTKELHNMFLAVYDLLDTTLEAIRTNDLSVASQIEPKEQVIDLFKSTFRRKHMGRLAKKKCTAESGIAYLEVVNNLERVADHCSNVGVAIIQLHSEEKLFNSHEYLEVESIRQTEEYSRIYNDFMAKYYAPLIKEKE